MLRIGIKFCGNCNPQLDTLKLLLELKTYFPEVEFVPWDAGQLQGLLILSGCSVDCATRFNFSGPQMVVAGLTLNTYSRSPEEILTGLKQWVIEMCN